jgi:hypothetical protein
LPMFKSLSFFPSDLQSTTGTACTACRYLYACLTMCSPNDGSKCLFCCCLFYPDTFSNGSLILAEQLAPKLAFVYKHKCKLAYGVVLDPRENSSTCRLFR